MNKPIIISLFDFTGAWSKPYLNAGYDVIQIDIKHGVDILQWDYSKINKNNVVGILSAPPCTDFAGSGARWWKHKDMNGETNYSVLLVKKTLEIINYFKPKFWVLENPVGRIAKLIPELGKPLYFHPYEFGDAYTKKTGLWGNFNTPQKNVVKPVMHVAKNGKRGSWIWAKLGGKSERTKALRSVTPKGFAKAFFSANNPNEFILK